MIIPCLLFAAEVVELQGQIAALVVMQRKLMLMVSYIF